MTFFSLCLVLLGKAQIINTVAGNGTWAYCGDGWPATQACLYKQYGIAVDKKGNLYIADEANYRIRKVDHTTGLMSTIAGNGGIGFSGDGGPATAAMLDVPVAVAVDNKGNVYFSDAINNRIRKVDTNGIITTIAGNGTKGYNGDGILATQAALNDPWGVSCDKKGNVFVADWFNFRIRKIDSAGIISTYAGNGSYGWGGDGGPAINAQLTFAQPLACDSNGNLFVALCDSGVPPSYLAVHVKIRKIDALGIISTIAGDSTGFSGDGGPALLAKVYVDGLGIAVDKIGNVYFGNGGSRVRKITTDGIIHTIAGTGVQGFSGDGGPPLLAQFQGALGIAVDTSGNLYISDESNSRVRKITWNQNASGIRQAAEVRELEVYPNPGNGTFFIKAGDENAGECPVQVCDIAGRLLIEQTLPVHQGQAELHTTLPPGTYFLKMKQSNGNFAIRKIVVAD